MHLYTRIMFKFAQEHPVRVAQERPVPQGCKKLVDLLVATDSFQERLDRDSYSFPRHPHQNNTMSKELRNEARRLPQRLRPKGWRSHWVFGYKLKVCQTRSGKRSFMKGKRSLSRIAESTSGWAGEGFMQKYLNLVKSSHFLLTKCWSILIQAKTTKTIENWNLYTSKHQNLSNLVKFITWTARYEV